MAGNGGRRRRYDGSSLAGPELSLGGGALAEGAKESCSASGRGSLEVRDGDWAALLRHRVGECGGQAKIKGGGPCGAALGAMRRRSYGCRACVAPWDRPPDRPPLAQTPIAWFHLRD